MLYLGIKIFNVAVIVGTSSFLISSISKLMLIKMYLLILVEVVKNMQLIFCCLLMFLYLFL